MPAHTLGHTPTQAINNTHNANNIHIPLCIPPPLGFYICLVGVWRQIMTARQIKYVGFKCIIFSSNKKQWAANHQYNKKYNVSQVIIVRDTLKNEALLNRQSVPSVNFFVIKFFTGNNEHIYGDNPICVYGSEHV